MFKKYLLSIFILLFLTTNVFAYRTMQIIAIDSAVWEEINFPENWVYKSCHGSFIEYPEFVDPTIHYRLQFIDENNHKKEMRFNRFKGELDRNATIIDFSDFSETYIQIR